MSATAGVRMCALCPVGQRADGLLWDRLGVPRPVCVRCAVLVWCQDWPGVEEGVLDDVLNAQPRWLRAVRRRRARLFARRWAAAVRTLTRTEDNPS